jgi:general secretion pathway protein D
LDVPRDLTVGGGGLRFSSLDTLLASAVGAVSTPLGSTLQHAMTLSNWKFEMLVYALSQHTGGDMLSAPKITTKSGQEAEIKVAREFTYPEEYDPPKIETTVSRLPNGETLRLVTPSTPTSFTTEDTGVLLTVNPQVGPDNLTIDLTLVPKVVEFDGFINYGSPINTLLGAGLFGSGVPGTFGIVKLTDNIINKPVFTVRQVETKVQIADGQTVLIGGLIREDVQKVDDKLPFFGDIPLIGRAFRSKIDQSIKKNLMIFVTCNLVRPDGELFNKRPGYDDNSFRNTVEYTEVSRYSGGPDPKELK